MITNNAYEIAMKQMSPEMQKEMEMESQYREQQKLFKRDLLKQATEQQAIAGSVGALGDAANFFSNTFRTGKRTRPNQLFQGTPAAGDMSKLLANIYGWTKETSSDVPTAWDITKLGVSQTNKDEANNARFANKDQDQKYKFTNDFDSHDLIKNGEELGSIREEVNQLISDGKYASINTAIKKLLRSSGAEKGVLTNQDFGLANPNASIDEAVDAWFTKSIQGKSTEVARKYVQQLMTNVDANYKNKLFKYVDKKKPNALVAGFTPDEYNQFKEDKISAIFGQGETRKTKMGKTFENTTETAPADAVKETKKNEIKEALAKLRGGK